MELAGKDYFRVEEAAEYACISVSHWRAQVQPIFPPGLFYGRLLYRKSDVQRFIEQRVRWPIDVHEERGSMRRQASRRVRSAR